MTAVREAVIYMLKYLKSNNTKFHDPQVQYVAFALFRNWREMMEQHMLLQYN